MLDLDDLLHPLDDDAPCGEDLEYDPDFIALEMANQPGEERVIGDAVIPAEDPDYEQVITLATPLLGRTKDLRIAVIMANAALQTNGLPGFAACLHYIRNCLDDFWDHVHPQLDNEDDDDPTMRVNAILGLTNRASVLRSLRMASLVDSRAFGRFSLRDIEVASGEVTPTEDMENTPTQQTIAAAFQDEDADALAQTVAASAAILEHVKAIADILDDRIGTMGPDLTPLQKVAFDINKHLAVHTGGETETSTDETIADAPEAAPAPQASSSGGAINTPDDVVSALERIVDYYARNEPSSPLPILLNRAKRLVSADFVTIMKDMAPAGVENVALIGGLPEDTDEDDEY